jgi:hypothetical protein
MPALPKKAFLDLNQEKLFIDGKEFPWYITEEGVEVTGLLGRNELPTLSFAMFAETVEVIPKDAAPYTISTETTTE